MNTLKNMEAIFVVALAGFGVGSYLLDNLPQAQAKTKQAVVEQNIATPTSMAVVVIRAPQARP